MNKLVIGSLMGLGLAVSISTTNPTSIMAKNKAVATTLNSGTFTVGQDIKAGRYTITTTAGSGNVMDSNGDINIILGDSTDEYGQVDSYTTDLKKGDDITIDGIETTNFTPTPSKRTYQKTLNAGSWKVGKDIKPGRYKITALQGSGNLISNFGTLNSILGTEADSNTGQVTNVTANLHRGETINSDIEQIQLTKK